MREFESETIRIIFDDKNGIYKMILKKEFINLKIAETIINERVNFNLKDKILLYVDCSLVKSFDKDARNYLGSNDTNKDIIAYTMFAKTTISAFLANFIINVNLNSLSTPRKFFSNEKKAIKWLKKFK